MRTAIYTVLARLIRIFYVKTRIPHVETHLRKAYSIFVANHLGSFGPLTLMSALLHRLQPWVTHEVTELRECAAYVRKDFVEKELKMRSFLGQELSRVIGRICVDLMRFLKAIPVYQQGRKLFRTLELSVACLKAGRGLLIFPENDESKMQDDLCLLNTGFIRVAQWLYSRTQKIATFYPVAVHKRARAVRIGQPVRFDPTAPYGEERIRIKRELEHSIRGMYREMEVESRGALPGRSWSQVA
jgi:1-acyl-sn-glycerol-3-phosphate acyltransferase